MTGCGEMREKLLSKIMYQPNLIYEIINRLQTAGKPIGIYGKGILLDYMV